MTSDSSPERFSDTDPVRNVFVEAELTNMLEPHVAELVDLFTDAVNRGLVPPEIAEARQFILKLDRDERLRILRNVVEGLHREIDEERNMFGDTRRNKHRRLYLEHLSSGDPKSDFVPLRYFKDDETGSGMTPEEWAALPQSTKDTLRELKYD